MKINEIFYSIQGEGKYTGTPCVFIRTSGCNLKCSFCDTQHEMGDEMSVGEICREVNRYPSYHVVITGGEPSMQDELRDLVCTLKTCGKYVQVETNGTNKLPSEIDWITCSPKNKRVVLDRIDELKVVYQSESQDMEYYKTLKSKKYYLQPCDVGDETKNKRILEATIKYILYYPKWKLSLQTQKIINVR